MDDYGKAILKLDISAAQQLLVARGISPPGDEVTLLTLHKCRYETPTMPTELRHASGYWLRMRGCGRLDGTCLLPEGQLPV